MRIEVNGEWVETSFWFWVLVIFIVIFTFWYWGPIAFLLMFLLSLVSGIQTTDPLFNGIAIFSVLFALIFAFIVSFGICLGLERYVF